MKRFPLFLLALSFSAIAKDPIEYAIPTAYCEYSVAEEGSLAKKRAMNKASDLIIEAGWSKERINAMYHFITGMKSGVTLNNPNQPIECRKIGALAGLYLKASFKGEQK